jgi:uncharacterized surface protein with fasciclin (FAS1) repeats
MSLLEKPMIIRRTLMVLSLAALAAGCATTPTPTTIADTAAANPQLSTLSKLVADAGLTETLRGTGPFTVFAPTDEAFKAVPAKTMQELAANKEMLKAVLTYHVIAGKVMAADVKVGNVKTVNGANLALGKAGTFVTVEEALVQQADVAATNGVVHVIDKVLLPPKR